MKRILKYIIIVVGIFLVFSSCKKDDATPNKTLFIYMPWSSNLTAELSKNIDDVENYISSNNIKGNNVLYFFSDSPTVASMYAFKKKGKKVTRELLKVYNGVDITTEEGLSTVLNDVKSFSPTKVYSMQIGCHAMGWIPVHQPTSVSGRDIEEPALDGEYVGQFNTRFFGGLEARNQTDMSTLAKALKKSGIKMEYILFDDCYVCCVETAYELRDVTHYLIGSPCEMMARGLPYHKILGYMLNKPNYSKICSTFYEDYFSSTQPWGALSVIDCGRIENIVQIMRKVNSAYQFNNDNIYRIQKFDGYYNPLFLDLSDYVHSFCTDQALLKELDEAIDKAVIARVNLPYYYSATSGSKHKIDTFCGLTISDPTVNHWGGRAKYYTLWWKETHK